jgi:hypothetical protein
MNKGCKYPGIDGGEKLLIFEKSLICLQLQVVLFFFAVSGCPFFSASFRLP